MDYQQAYDIQLDLVEKRKAGIIASDIFLLTEHPAVYTLGRRGGREHLMVSDEFLQDKGVAVIHVERGGDITCHEEGQVVVYPIINLRSSGLSIAEYIFKLEEVMIRLSSIFGVHAVRDPRNRGIWVGDCKLGSVGIAIRHGITFHGMALNVNNSLDAFRWIHPCGLTDMKMTSLAKKLRKELPMSIVKELLVEFLQAVFEMDFEPLEYTLQEKN